MVCPCNKYAFRAFHQRDWLQQYANAKILQMFLQTFASFWSIYFILHVREALCSRRFFNRDVDFTNITSHIQNL